MSFGQRTKVGQTTNLRNKLIQSVAVVDELDVKNRADFKVRPVKPRIL